VTANTYKVTVTSTTGGTASTVPVNGTVSYGGSDFKANDFRARFVRWTEGSAGSTSASYTVKILLQIGHLMQFLKEKRAVNL
jgi:hypothetical protein